MTWVVDCEKDQRRTARQAEATLAVVAEELRLARLRVVAAQDVDWLSPAATAYGARIEELHARLVRLTSCLDVAYQAVRVHTRAADGLLAQEEFCLAMPELR
ncbi:hypothetical protein [Actinotalea sp. K2]|uniref:hypothetical protein n=1 Tax=Actinotalea sp. K2 TaxID=2939438 RepID=UPI002017EBA4|nr:hypothetical protein [Actinotalea sp. K2]MCL3861655.1 hypothetical protein [Actinotalea sp. K2]